MVLARRLSHAIVGIIFLSPGFGQQTAPVQTPLDPQNDPRLVEAKRLDGESETLHNKTQDQEAITLEEKALQLRKDYYKTDHDEVADTILNIAIMLHSAYQLDAAANYYKQAQEMRSRLHGNDSAPVAQVLGLLATMRTYQSRFKEARDLNEQALRIRQSVLSPDDPDIASSLIQIANLLNAEGNHNDALGYSNRAMKINQKAFGEKDSRVADNYTLLAVTYTWLSQYDSSLENYNHAIAIGEELYGKEDPRLEYDLNGRAIVLRYLGRIGEARADAERAVRLVAPNGEDTMDATGPLLTLAGIFQDDGDYASARASYERVLRIRKMALGEKHRNVADSMNDLANALHYEGKLTEARVLYEQARSIDTELLGEEHADVANMTNNIAYLLSEIGDVAAARQYFERALRIRKKVLPENHLDIALSLDGLGTVLTQLGLYSDARERFQQSLEIREKALGENHRLVAASLSGLARAAEMEGDLNSAENYRNRELEILKKTLGDNNPYTAASVYEHGKLLEMRGNYDAAKADYSEAYDVFAKVFGPYHPQFTKGLISLSLINWRDGNLDATNRFLRDAARTMDSEIKGILPNLSFAEQRNFVDDRLPGRASILLSYAFEQKQLAYYYEYLFQWKGLLIENLRRATAITGLARNPKYKDGVERLEATRAHLAGWYHKLGSVQRADWESKNAALTAEKEQLERDLTAALPNGSLTDALGILGLNGFQSLMRPHEVFVDIYQYTRYANGKTTEKRFAAIVLSKSVGPRMCDLAPALEIDLLISDWRKAVFRGGPATSEWESLRRVLWNPIAAALPNSTNRIWLSPDGELSRVPWNLLPSMEQKRITSVSVIDSARELANLRLLRAGNVKRNVLIVGNIDFAGQTQPGQSPLRYPVLTATGKEVDAVKILSERVGITSTTLTEGRATKTAVLSSISDFGYIHLATHGFFFNDTEATGPSRSAASRSVWIENGGSAGRNPLVESGIALAGANLSDATTLETPGLLTAEELVGINLSRVNLMVLSACDTGRGTEVSGQGVFGLRASVMAAGARSMLMSLWKVPDEATRELMKEFYSNLWRKKMPKARALLEAQLTLKNDPSGRFNDPLNWAAWVLAGEAW
jgi:CHAT domain-containing protein/tetratricopeptide (TPR) repeat protein